MTTELVPPTHLPDGYRQVLYWKLSEHRMLLVLLNVAGLVLMGVAAAPLWAWARLWHPAALSIVVGMVEISIMAVGLLMTIVLHEWMHGIALRCYGARPRYGVMWKEMMFYATAPGHAFRRNHYLASALAPLVSLSLLGLLLLTKTKSEISDWAQKMAAYQPPKFKKTYSDEESEDQQQDNPNKPE